MAQLRTREVRQLLHNKFVVVLGDSIQRAVYKDLVLLLQKDCLLSPAQLKSKGELSFEQDVLLEGGRWGRMHNGTHYREVRQFCSGRHLVRFYFLTRAYSPYVEDVLAQLRWGEHAPDVVVLNSCLWDLSRYGRDFRTSYRSDLEQLFRRLDQVLPESCLLVWNTTMPVAHTVTAAFLPPDAEPCASRLRGDVMEANFYSAAEAARRGFDVLDLHFHFRHAGRHRLHDGVHWDERAHRHLSQLLLAHVADAWGVMLPRRSSVSGWIADTPVPRQPPGPTDYQEHPGDHRPREPTPARRLPSRLRCRSMSSRFPPQARFHPFLPPRHHLNAQEPQGPPLPPPTFYRSPRRHPRGYARGNSMNREYGPGPIRRVYDPTHRVYNGPIRRVYDGPIRRVYDGPIRRVYGPIRRVSSPPQNAESSPCPPSHPSPRETGELHGGHSREGS